MNRDFYIDNLSDEYINQISISLNELEEVTRLKIVGNSVKFVCHDTTQIETIVKEIDESIVLHEVVNEEKMVFEEERQKKELIFLFVNLNSKEEADEIEEILSKYRTYENVRVDFKNRLLTLTTADQNVEKRLNRIVDKVNMNIDVTLWQKPYRSQDLFNEVYIRKYLRHSFFFVAMALALVTYKDHNLFTGVAWFIVTVLVCDKTFVNVYKNLRKKKFIMLNNTFVLALVLGFAYGAYFEMFMVGVLYTLSEEILAMITTRFVREIDKSITLPYMGRKKITATKFEMIPLSDFDIGDILVIYPGETVLLSGKISKGETKVDTYAIDGNEVLVDLKTKDNISSGVINLGNEIHIKVLDTYENSAFSKLLNIAANAPTYETRTQRLAEKIYKYSTILFVFVTIIISVLLPILDYITYNEYLYIGAILLTIASGHAIKESASFGVLAGVARAFKDGVLVKENSSLDSLHVCQTIIYDRFDGVELTDDELALFENLKTLHQDIIIFNDGPVDLENDQYNIYNNLTIEEKIIIMQQANLIGPVAYIGDGSKDLMLLQKSYVAISRGGLHDNKITDHSDIIIIDASHDTIFKMFKLSKKQSYIAIQNNLLTILGMTSLILLALSGLLSWITVQICYFILMYIIIANTCRIFRENKVKQ